MKLNARKTKTMRVSRSRTVYPQPNPLTLDGTVLKESADFVILEVTFDAKMTFESTFAMFPVLLLRGLHGIMRKSWQVFHEDFMKILLLRYFWNVVLLILEYCSAV